MTDSVRDIRQQPFYWIERDLLPAFGQKIGPHGIAVYNALVFRSDRSGRAFPGMSDIATLTGIRSKNTIKKALAALEDAHLIKVVMRFNSGMKKYETNEYYILPVGHQMPDHVSTDDPRLYQQMTHPVSRNDTPVSGDDLPVSGDDTGVYHDMTQVYQEMTHPVSGDDTDLHVFNYNHEQQSLTKSSNNSMHAAAAESLLSAYAVKAKNGDREDIAAWLVYALTQPGLTNPVGYAFARVKREEPVAAVYREIVSLDVNWPDLLKYANYANIVRSTPGVQGITVPDELNGVSDAALDVLCELYEAQR